MTLAATAQLDVLETFRVPYAVEGEPPLGVSGRLASLRGAELLWVAPGSSTVRRWHRVAEMPLFAAVATDAAVRRGLDASGRNWRPTDPVTDSAGEVVAHVWSDSDGSALLPFDPNAVVRAFLREEYVDADGAVARGATALARKLYYRLRPALPRAVQIDMRRRFARIQERAPFPSWPAEPALHDFYGYLLRLVEGVLAAPLPWIAPWPTPHEWAVVLTHDVEREAGYRHVGHMVALERRLGVRSAWYFVPERDYTVEPGLVRSLAEGGFEIGVHGLRHDGRDLAEGEFERRLSAMRAYGESWGAVGFRAPATHRSWERMQQLGFAHDSSYADVARYEPQSGGSCSLLPFFLGGLVELPITLPMDHTLFELLDEEDGRVWFEKASFVRERGGMALLLTHPDYLLDPIRLAEYERFVAHVGGDSSAWLALPRDVADWWRRRAASKLEPSGALWRISGPAAGEARVVMGVSGLT
ncbi:MAG: hypothetical protein H0U82_11270 [Actinobacteria bacterium]|nr:hypothetical protein [Actinomycetota bacterium]